MTDGAGGDLPDPQPPWEIRGNAAPIRRTTIRIPGPFLLEKGGALPELEVACETYGDLDPEGGNAVLVCPALSADRHAAGLPESAADRPSAVDGYGAAGRTPGLGWWDSMIGPGKAFDTDRLFVVATSLLGGCGGTTGPTSLDPRTGRRHGGRFPAITVGDMVRAQRLALERLGVARLRAVTGGSLGGMQALDWAARYPDAVDAILPIASTARLGAQGIAWNAVARNAITADPAWSRGDYPGDSVGGPDRGLGVARMIGHVTYLSAAGMDRRFGRARRDPEASWSESGVAEIERPDFEVEAYLRHQARSFAARFDANSYLLLSRALTWFDLAGEWGDGSLEAAVSRFRCRTLLLSFRSDWLYPPGGSEAVARALEARGLPVDHVEIDAAYGHDSFLLEAARMTPVIRRFLDSLPTAGRARRP